MAPLGQLVNIAEFSMTTTMCSIILLEALSQYHVDVDVDCEEVTKVNDTLEGLDRDRVESVMGVARSQGKKEKRRWLDLRILEPRHYRDRRICCEVPHD